MKTILMLPFSVIVAHVVRPLEVGKVLREMGYRVVFAGAGQPMALVRQAGFEVRPLPELDHAWGMARIWQGPRALYSVEKLKEFVQAELALLQELRPAAVVIDGRLSGGISATLAGRGSRC